MLDSVSFDPVLRPGWIAMLVVVLAVFAVLRERRARVQIGRWWSALVLLLRLAFIAGLALLLMRPMVMKPIKKPARFPVFSVLVDRSCSMNTEDAGVGEGESEGEASRAEAVARGLADARLKLEHELPAQYQVQYYEFSDQLRAASLDGLINAPPPEGEHTDLATALFTAAENGGPHQVGMLLVSDGRVNHVTGSSGVMQAARYLRSRKVPVWTSTVGRAGKSRDMIVSAQLNQNFLFVRQPGSIDVIVDQSGYDDWQATIRLKREGAEIASRQVMFTGAAAQLSFPINEEAPGLFQYDVEVDPLPGESEASNNNRSVFARVTARRSQVLVLEAQPYWDSKFMVRALQSDPNLDVTSIFQVNDTKQVAIRQAAPVPDRDQDPDPPVVRIPRTREELFFYDVVIFGRGADLLYSAEEFALFRDYLTERGGNLIFARGSATESPSSDLAALEPVVWSDQRISDVRFSLTGKGRDASFLEFEQSSDTDLLIQELPSMLTVARVEKEKSLAVVLARTETGAPGDEIAVIAWQRYGAGKVLSIGGAGLWRWSLAPDSAERYLGVYEAFWSQLARWLVAYSDFLPDQQITFDVSRNQFDLGDRVRLTVRTRLADLANYHPILELAGRDGPARRLELDRDPEQPGVFSASFIADEEGEFEAKLRNNIGEPTEDTVRFAVYEESIERRFVAADRGLMDQVARTTGGEPLGLDELRELPERLSQYEQQTVEKPKPVDAWDKPLYLFLLAGLISLEWLIRRLGGLA